MQKYNLIICNLILISCICFSGCNELDNKQNQTPDITTRFIANWEFIRSALDYETWSFYTNESARNNITETVDGESITTRIWYDYVLIESNRSICFSTKNEPVGSPNYVSIYFNYNFSNDFTHLTLSSHNIVILDLEKIT
jgi:hypothetical protein